MKPPSRFPAAIVDAIRKDRILGMQAGSGGHRPIGIWVVVVEGRIFVRSWDLRPGGWNDTLRRERRGTMTIGRKRVPFRAVLTRSETRKKAVDRAYREKYSTAADAKYVRGLSQPRRRSTTIELAPGA